jgi:superfamily II DNA or RNA helicase
MPLDIIIDNKIRFNPEYLDNSVLEEIFSQLRIDNPRKIRAEREMICGAENLPDYIELWKYSSHNKIEIPRGVRYKVLSLIADNDIEINLIDNTSHYKNYHKNVGLIPLRDYQSKAIEKLAIYNNGIYSAPTGAGKSRVMLELIRTLGQKTLIICEKTDIAQQWINFAQEFGFDVGLAYEKIWDDDKDLIISLRQSLWRRKDELGQEWFDQFGTIIYDEVHHSVAETSFDLVQRFPARYRFGCSATPDADPELFPIAEAVIGPVVAISTPEEIGEHLVIPSVKVINTEFDFPYRPTFRQGNKVVRNNYNSMMESLEEDDYRNSMIMNFVLIETERGNNCLVVSKRKNHLKNLEGAAYKYLRGELGPKVFLLTGDNSKEAYYISHDINFGETGSILFSTLADEGTDIPRLNRIFLAYPGRKLRGYEQAIGRIMRPHPKKKDAIVYDFRDVKVPLLNSQYRFRAQGIYNKKNYKVEVCE